MIIQRKNKVDWENENPILALDVIGVEISDDSRLIKIGDGVTSWIELPYVQGDASQTELIDDLYNVKQDKLTAGANISIVDNIISASGGGGGSVIVDSELSDTSINPVQNKVINAALHLKQDGLGNETFKIKEFTKDNISISGSGDSENIIAVALNGYTPISSLGFRVRNASSSGVGSSYANVYRADIVPSSNQFVVYARNIRTSAIKVAVNVRILYIKNEFITL